MRTIDEIIIHAADTPPDMRIGADEIDAWHRDRGWSGIGYHYVIPRSGMLEHGRPEDNAGAHVRGKNANSIGVCLVGGRKAGGGHDANFTAEQWRTLEALVRQLLRDFPGAKVSGHRDHDPSKACPCFDAAAWAEDLVNG
ncbi:N-acetylmuramoyl-L-alanine amidase [Thioalkalivibrio sp. ALE12]|uniref:N-acetylmuramoyl-L-alanine amidase n=1 Tax=Thioalkalivibrio sp. ALE12 TaxID=1158170 RepID=UPI00036B3D2A|nr:N-acetylmuramoyl-L-alanine amidase [Thioalkalivibrio sp. ALE12]